MMFSSNALLQIVFAEQNDNYFWEGIFKAELNRYLWYQLHDNYSTVYFAEGRENDIQIRWYEESYTDEFRLKGFFQKNPKTVLAKWLKKQIKDKKHKSAVVFSLENFCHIFESEEETLHELKEAKEYEEICGTIIVIAPTNNAKASKLFRSSVFKALDEQSVLAMRNYSSGDMYEFLQNQKNKACVFLNKYTRERVSDIISYIMLEEPNRFTSRTEMENMIDYLTQYMNNRYLQMTEERIFPQKFGLINPLYKDLYGQLKDRKVWDALVSRSRQYNGTLKEHLIHHYVSEKMIESCANTSYNDETIEMRCMKLCSANIMHEVMYDEPTIEKLAKIYHEVRIYNRIEKNIQVEEKLSYFIDRLESVRNSGDKETCGRIISAILFCVTWLRCNNENTNDVIQMIDAFNSYVQLSAIYYTNKKGYESSSYRPENIRRTIEQYHMQLEQLDRVISTGNLSLMLSRTTVNFVDIHKQMSVIMSGGGTVAVQQSQQSYAVENVQPVQKNRQENREQYRNKQNNVPSSSTVPEVPQTTSFGQSYHSPIPDFMFDPNAPK